MRSSFIRANILPVTWSAVLLVALVWIAVVISGGSWLKSNVFELLPESDYDPLTEVATQTVDREFGTRLLFFIGHTDRGIASDAVDQFGERLLDSPLIAAVTTRIDESEYAAIASFYYPYRRQILSDIQIANIQKDAAGIERAALKSLYSPLGTGGGALTTDPFFLFPGSLQALRPPGSTLAVEGGYLWAQRDETSYILVIANIESPTLSIIEQRSLAQHMNTAIDEMAASQPDLDILKTGFAFYAHEATESAKGEISTIGLGSMLGLLLLVFATFRSLRPLSLIIVSIVAGCCVALAVTLSVFGFVHMFTLVFGASLIGVSVDYSFHYVADGAFADDDWTPRRGLRNIFAGITLGLLTSVMAYMALTVAPFPGLQQLAVFSSAGLIGAYFTLLCLCTLWRRRMPVRDESLILRAASSYLGVWQRSRSRNHYLLIAALAVIILIGYQTIAVDDDVSVLQAQPPELKRQEAAIQELLGVAQAGTFLLATSASDEDLLQLEESVREQLDEMIGAGTLSGYQAMSRWVPSRVRQLGSHSAYTDLIQRRLPGYFESLGVGADAARDTLAELTREMRPLLVDDWLEHPSSTQFRKFWLPAPDGARASIVLLYGVGDVAALTAAVAAYPSIKVVNKARELSSLFGQYRERVAQLLAAAYLIILLGLSIRYGLRRSTILMIPPVFAGFVSLIVISAAGQTLNLFNFLAMILVLGIGVDFTLFIVEAKDELKSTMFAITLSALTTMLSFGLLALSSTYAVHSFGVTVLIGIACAYLLSPLAIAARIDTESK